MPPFPYFAILKEAYELTIKNRFLWVFGLFLGGASVFNVGSWTWLRDKPSAEEVEKLESLWMATQNSLTGNPKLAGFLFFALLAIIALLILLSGLAKTGLIWSADELSKPAEERKKKINLPSALTHGVTYLFPVIALQILMTVVFLALLVILAAPTLYLFFQGETGKGLVLLLLALAIFIPGSVVFSFLNLYGPVAIVLYGRAPLSALQFAFNLLRSHLKESIILAAVLAGLSFLVVLAAGFLLVLLSLPLALLALISWWAGTLGAMYLLIGATILLVIFCVIVFRAAFSAYQNVVWVLATKHLVKLRKSPKKAEALAAEPI